ncbi:hypothetical protein OKW39_000061 [Paraburkholderia sp. MM6662-R1]
MSALVFTKDDTAVPQGFGYKESSEIDTRTTTFARMPDLRKRSQNVRNGSQVLVRFPWDESFATTDL